MRPEVEAYDVNDDPRFSRFLVCALLVAVALVVVSQAVIAMHRTEKRVDRLQARVLILEREQARR